MDSNNTPNQNKATFDPGWNDPPKFSYTAQTTQPNRPRNFLNKRVAFPLSSTNAQANVPVNLPPMQTAPAGPPMLSLVDNSPNTSCNDVESVFDSDKLLQDVKQVLLDFLQNNSELRIKANDIQRRIVVMEEMWTNGKLNKSIQWQMKELAYALRDDQPSKADHIHRALMVDHVSAVGTWMPGVKHLVHHCIAKSELLAIEKDS